MSKPNQLTFGEAFVDVDEWRDSPRPHRYVHGGFEGTHTRSVSYTHLTLPTTERV